jgi:hypothetical protein
MLIPPVVRITSGASATSSAAFLRKSASSRSQAILDLHVAADRPAQLLQTLLERGAARLRHGIVRRLAHEHADPPHALALLRALQAATPLPLRRAAI